MTHEASYYIVIPGPVRRDARLNAEQKILYGELSSKCWATGYCWATNKRLCELMECTERTLQRNLKLLSDCGHIVIKLHKDDRGTVRHIWLVDGHPTPTPANNDAPVPQSEVNGGAKNGEDITHTVQTNHTNLTSDVRASEHEGIAWPWETETFWEAWVVWREYKRKQHRFTFKVRASEQAALNLLNELAGGSEAVAHAIMRQSMGNGWKGFVALKNQAHATHQQAAGAGGGRQGTSEARNRANQDY